MEDSDHLVLISSSSPLIREDEIVLIDAEWSRQILEMNLGSCQRLPEELIWFEEADQRLEHVDCSLHQMDRRKFQQQYEIFGYGGISCLIELMVYSKMRGVI